ncbi:MAG TPA: hypothetical protein VKA95_14760 [Nitrososphaeraceae archaeon]|jgi:hypothetical protein|nr:hypothetical protein [Nitrososphaeraceae archaeon]
MGKTKSASSRSSEDEALPKWAEDEIKSVQFGEPEILTRTGYILDIYENDFKIDIQLYEALPDGRTIIEGLNVPRSSQIVDFMKGVVYEFKIKMFHGSLSSKLIELLRTKYTIEMDTIYRFDLEEIQMMDVESDLPSMPPSSDGEDEDGEDGKG